jgi:hypothetical protein
MGTGGESNSGPTTMDKIGGANQGRVDGTTQQEDAQIQKEERRVDQKVKSICKGC